MGKNNAYQPEIHEAVREWCNGLTNRQLADKINAAYGTEMDDKKVKDFMSNHHIVRTVRGRMPVYSKVFPEEIASYINDHYLGCGPKEMSERLNKMYEREYTRQQLKTFYKNHSLNSGLDGRFQPGHKSDPNLNKGKHLSPGTEFKKGNRPHNWVPVGTETVNSEGYRVRKTADPAEWEFVHRLVWEEAHGPIQPGQKILFLDGDKLNCSLDNLAIVNSSELQYLNVKGLRFTCAEATQAGIMIARAKVKANRLKRQEAER